MYKVYAIVDGERYLLHDPRLQNIRLGEPYYDVGDNVNGQAEFTVYKNHPYYSYVRKLTTEIVFYDGTEEVFRGRVMYDDEDEKGSKKVFVEGQLAYLCDSRQRPAVYHNISVANYFTSLLENHNNQVEDRKKFYPGRVTVVDSNDSLYRYSNWEDTRKCISEKLIDRLGGHLVVRWADGVRYLDYLADEDYYSDCAQKIEFGKNMLDFSRTITAADLATCVIPLGYKLPDDQQNPDLQEQRLTIASVNNGLDYVMDSNAVAAFGRIYTTVVDDDITRPANLLNFGRKYLQTVQYEQLVLEMKAIDLGIVDPSKEKFGVGKRIHCISAPHAMDIWLPLSEMKVYITHPDKRTITIGDQHAIETYTSSNSKAQNKLSANISAISSANASVISAVREKVNSSDVEDIISEQIVNIRNSNASIAWSADYSSMTSEGRLTCRNAVINDPTFNSTSGVDRLTVSQAVMNGYHNDNPVGYVELIRQTTNGNLSSYDAVIGSNSNLLFEAGTAGSFIFYINGTMCGYIDASGWHNATNQSGGS